MRRYFIVDTGQGRVDGINCLFLLIWMDEPARKRHKVEEETQEEGSGHTSLPPELWVVVVQHVTPKDILLGLCPCCSFFSRLFRSNNLLWQHQLVVHYPEKVSIYKVSSINQS